MALDYKKLSDDRRQLLNDIRLLIKKSYPGFFQNWHISPPITDILESVFEQTKQIEKGRDAFRDELIRHGYNHDDLSRLVKEHK